MPEKTEKAKIMGLRVDWLKSCWLRRCRLVTLNRLTDFMKTAAKISAFCLLSLLVLFLAPARLFAEFDDANSAVSGEVSDGVDFTESESTEAQKRDLSPVSGRMLEKMRELEKTAAETEGQDDAALEKIGGKIDRTIALLPLNGDLIAAIKDKRFDWRVRCLLMFYKSYTAGESKITKYSGDFIG
ncbi:MAG: hypothetical protein HY550_06570, partial [Elusimicrobia bacterium]|nr:hypothetical protein [Elusimicrobiota bacterium]